MERRDDAERKARFAAWLGARIGGKGQATQSDFATAAGTSTSNVSRWLSGQQLPRYEMARAVGVALRDVEGAMEAAGYELDAPYASQHGVVVRDLDSGHMVVWDAPPDLPDDLRENIERQVELAREVARSRNGRRRPKA